MCINAFHLTRSHRSGYSVLGRAGPGNCPTFPAHPPPQLRPICHFRHLQLRPSPRPTFLPLLQTDH
ncbi:hypothetical protein BJV78DRAFT_1223696 [Lactifluus subvellereus]|nr:hypothetical protein BJV78DRAFT_1223696 [Lactifluus subvellereus]